MPYSATHRHVRSQLRDYWKSQITEPGALATIEVTSGLSKATLDVIGLAGFNYAFDALDPSGKPNELNQAFTSMFRALTSSVPGFWMVLKFTVRALRIFVSALYRDSPVAVNKHGSLTGMRSRITSAARPRPHRLSPDA